MHTITARSVTRFLIRAGKLAKPDPRIVPDGFSPTKGGSLDRKEELKVRHTSKRGRRSNRQRHRKPSAERFYP